VNLLRTSVCGAFLCVAIAASAQETKVSRPGEYSGYSRAEFAETVRVSQFITARDGTRLAADIYLPAANGKPVARRFPVIWQHTLSRTGGRPQAAANGFSLAAIPSLTKFGYVVAIVDRRGMGSSFGARRGYIDRTESRDAYDVTEWLAAQSWSDGNVGAFGCSNTGAAAMHVPVLMPPHLKAVFAGCYAWDTYDGFLRGGIFANWGTGPERTIDEDLRQNAPVDDDKDGVLLRAAVDEHRGNTPIYSMWKSIPYRDGWSDLTGSQFWLETNVATYRGQLAQSKVAIYTQGGWNDDFRAQGLIAYSNLKNPKKILIGPWEHCRTDNFDLPAEYLRFFDRWLKNIDNGIMNEPPIRYYTVNAPQGKEWRFANAWPLPEAKPVVYYLQPARERDENKISTSRGANAKASQTIDYSTSCGANWPLLTQTCVQDSKGMVFNGEPLVRDTEVTGHPMVSLWISSTASDGNFFAYLEDVAPDGAVRIVTDGRLKASLRKTTAAPYDVFSLPWHRSLEGDVELLTPNEPTELRFDMLPISYIFKTGHRLRVNVTGADARERDRVVPATVPTITIYGGGKFASSLTLPIIGGN